MSYTLDTFIADTRANLEKDPGPAGREKVRQGLERLLAEPDFVARIAAIDPGARVTVLHADGDLGFRILAHVRDSTPHAPHNHGNSWAIYGQVESYTEMTEWERVGESGNGTELKMLKAYRLEPGQAGIYQNGAIHSVTGPKGGRIIRITGTDLDRIDRERFDPETGAMENLRKQA